MSTSSTFAELWSHDAKHRVRLLFLSVDGRRCRARVARQDAARLHRVLETLTPPAGAAELEIIPGGLKDFVSDAERRLLLESYRSLPGADDTAWACAVALGL